MCGIAGLIDPSSSADDLRVRLQRMLDLIAHRGPDGAGTHFAPGLGLGMRRLSIIDLEGGWQPIWNEDQSVGVVFNGEIYNYVELRRDLVAAGHVFRTHTDTEVLVHLYEDFGADMLSRLRGMFAFAILDRKNGRGFLARDHFGQKPLYYYRGDGRFAFASELKSLLTLPFVPRDTDPEALLDFATWVSLPPPRTHFRSIHKLPAGSHLTVDLTSGATIGEPQRYWRFDLESAPDIHDLGAAVDLIDAALAESVRVHFRADVPVGVLLSSGLDSRTVAAYARDLNPGGVSTFSVGYAEAGSELEGARESAREIGTNHHELTITGTGIGAVIDKLAWHLDEPIGDPAAFAVWQVCKFSREHVKVLLSGEGADEIFAGYDQKYRAQIATLERSAQLQRWAGWLPGEPAPYPTSRLGRMRRRAHREGLARVCERLGVHLLVQRAKLGEVRELRVDLRESFAHTLEHGCQVLERRIQRGQRQVPAQPMRDRGGIEKRVGVFQHRRRECALAAPTQTPALLEPAEVPDLPQRRIDDGQTRPEKLRVRKVCDEPERAAAGIEQLLRNRNGFGGSGNHERGFGIVATV